MRAQGVRSARRGEKRGWSGGRCLGGERVRGEGEGKWNLKELLKVHGDLLQRVLE